MNYSRIAVFMVGLIFLSACASKNDKHDASGTFEATEIIVSSEATGRILELNIEEGMDVICNQVVGHIDSTQLLLKKKQLLATRKAVESRRPDIQVQIAAIEKQIETAKAEKQRIENLLRANAATQKQLDDASAQIAILEKQLEAHRSSLEISNRSIGNESSTIDIQIAQIDDQLQRCKVISPIDGTVIVKYAEKGELTAQGKPLFKVADIKNMFLRAYITSDQLTKIQISQPVKVFADFGANEYREYDGVVTWISSKSEFTPKTVHTKDERANLVYAIKIAVENDGYIKIGMYGGVNFLIP